jgi:hypothetical protein
MSEQVTYMIHTTKLADTPQVRPWQEIRLEHSGRGGRWIRGQQIIDGRIGDTWPSDEELLGMLTTRIDNYTGTPRRHAVSIISQPEGRVLERIEQIKPYANAFLHTQFVIGGPHEFWPPYHTVLSYVRNGMWWQSVSLALGDTIPTERELIVMFDEAIANHEPAHAGTVRSPYFPPFGTSDDGEGEFEYEVRDAGARHVLKITRSNK